MVERLLLVRRVFGQPLVADDDIRRMTRQDSGGSDTEFGRTGRGRRRGRLTDPTVAEVGSYRAVVDEIVARATPLTARQLVTLKAIFSDIADRSGHQSEKLYPATESQTAA